MIGASGLVGGALMRALGPDAVGTYRSRALPGLRALEASDAAAARALLAEVRPDAVFFPAADPNVDWCEAHPEEAGAANVTPALLALAAARSAGAAFAFYSSDYVFDGTAGPYAEDDRPSPVSAYGRQKLEVERAVLAAGGTVVRTTGVYGLEPDPPKNFVLRLVASLRAGRRVRVPSDQVATPTWSDELAAGSIAVVSRGGVWNVAGPDLLARDTFARLVAEVFGLDGALVEGVPTSALGQLAARPLRGGLRTERIVAALGRPLVPTHQALGRLKAEVAARDRVDLRLGTGPRSR